MAENADILLASKLMEFENDYIRPLKSHTFTRDVPVANELNRTAEGIVMKSIQGVAQGGTMSMNGRSWLGQHANDLKGVGLEISAVMTRVFTGGREASWTALELERAREKGGIALDTEQIQIINEIFHDDAQAMAYLGDAEQGVTGLFNNKEIKTVTGAGLLEASAPDVKKVVKALNDYIREAEVNAGDAIAPAVMLVSPAVYTALFSLQLSDSNATSAIDYLQSKSLAYVKNGAFKIYAVKELKGIGGSQKDRAVLYTPNRDYLKFNIMPVWREKIYDKGLQTCAAYLWRIAELQIRRPESIVYIDNI